MTDVNQRVAGQQSSPATWVNLKVGEREPTFGVVIHSMVMNTASFIVYVGADFGVYWIAASGLSYPARTPDVLTRVAELQAEPTEAFDDRAKEAFASLTAQGVVQMLEGDDTSALAVLDKAEDYFNSRISEIARGWYLTSAAGALGLFAAIGAGVWLGRAHLMASGLSATGIELIAASTAGSVGAFLSLFFRLNRLPLDARAGLRLHILESVLRVLAGVLAALLCIWAVKADILLGFGKDGSIYRLLLIGALAGASERIVPSLVAEVESVVQRGARKEPPESK
jgi:ABC-type multidrug transport system fused ATPase/permease subunit